MTVVALSGPSTPGIHRKPAFVCTSRSSRGGCGPTRSYSIRNLWTGSYLLSYLTFRAMEPVIQRFGTSSFVTPNLTNNPLMEWFLDRRRPEKPERLTTPCLPNTFIAEIPEGLDTTAAVAQ